MQRFSLGFNQTSFGASNPISAAASRIGSAKSKVGSTSRIFNYCKEHSPAPSLCINQFVNITSGFNLNNIHVGNFPNAVKLNSHDAPQLGKPPYKPSDIKKAYSFPTIDIVPSPNVRKAIITIIVPYHSNFLIQNLQDFCSMSDIRQPDPGQIQIYNLGSDTNINPEVEIEANIDLQMAYAMNPHAEIRVIEAKSSGAGDLIYAIDVGSNGKNFPSGIDTDIMSMSFGATPNSYLVNASPFINPNICYLAASGDNSAPLWPAIIPNVLAIGATNLQTNTNYSRKTEAIWSKSGCGFTPYANCPYYQIPYNPNSKRSIPDVCAVGASESKVIVTMNGYIYAVYGTSVSSPIVAGILSLAVQKRLNVHNNKRLTTCQIRPFDTKQLQFLLYNFLTIQSFFFDVVEGKSGKYSAKPGFDQASGLGVINVNNLIEGLKDI